MTDGKTFFDQPIKSYIKTYETFELLQLMKEMITNWLFVRLQLFQKT